MPRRCHIMIWTPRGKDRAGAMTHISVTPRGTFWITDHPIDGVSLHRADGTAKTPLGAFETIETAKAHAFALHGG